MGSIYKITNTLSGMAYIGKTVHDAEKTRKRNHLSGRGNKPLKDDIDKYGEDVFTFEILHDGIIPEFLDTLEREEIAKHNTMKPYGYNQNRGGGGVCSHSEETRQKMSEALNGKPAWNKGKPHSEEAQQKMSKAHIGKTHSEETRQKISEVTAGKKNPNYGKSHSEETLRRISENNAMKRPEVRQKISGENSPTKRPEVRQKISKALKGKPAWNKGKPHSEEAKQKMSEALKGNPAWNKGKPHSEETKQKISRANKGRKHSEETRRKNSKVKLGMSPEALTILIDWLLRAGWSKTKITRELRKSQNTIRKYAPHVSK